jgi:glycosyltransferase involved in cell wall biosynthesis
LGPVPEPSVRIAVFPYIQENPYQRLVYEALEAHGFTAGEGELKLGWLVAHRRETRVLHFHWPQPWYRHPEQQGGPRTWVRMSLFALRLAAARALGYRIAWTVHEVYPLNPAPRWVDRLGSRILARASHVLMANDPQTAAEARDELGPAADDIQVVRHPSYAGAYAEGRSRAEVRAELGIPDSAFVFLLFGHITAYKRVEDYVRAFRAAALDDAAIVVAGLVQHEPSAAAVRAAAAEDPRVKPVLEFIADDRVAELFGAADAAIAPRQDGGTSGALVLALSLGVPVVAARVDTYADVTGGDAAGWLFEPGDPRAVTAALEQAASDPDAARSKGAAGRALVTDRTWDGMAADLAALLRAALGRADDAPLPPPVAAPEHG